MEALNRNEVGQFGDEAFGEVVLNGRIAIYGIVCFKN